MLSFTRFATLCAILELISAKSATFTLKLDSSASALSGFEPSVHSDGSRIDLDASGSFMSGYIDDDGQLIVEDTVMGIGKNYLALKAASSSWIIAQPFTIVDGKLKLYGSDFHAVPNGEDSGYVLGSINAAASRSDMISVAIIPEGADGNAIQSYDASAQSSSAEGTTTSSTSSTIASTTSAQSTSSIATTAQSVSSSQVTVQSTTSKSVESVESTTSSQVTSVSSKASSQSASSSKAISQSTSSLISVQSTSSSNATTPQVSTFDNGALRNGVSAGVAVALLALL